jgi:methylornithine synthase
MRASDAVLRRALEGRPPTARELERLFSALAAGEEGTAGGEREGRERAGCEPGAEAELEVLFRVARELRRRHFGDRVFLYGFLYLSTFCRNDCTFCWYRRSNTACRRYRKRDEEVLEAAVRLADSGVHLLDLTLSEDPGMRTAEGFARLVGLTARVKRATGLPLMLSPGVVPSSVLLQLQQAGADWYACYQETHSPRLFRRLRPAQAFAERMRAKRAARRAGLLLEEGVLCGAGEGPRDLARSVRRMGRLRAEQVRVMSFVPREGIPLAARFRGSPERELAAIAALRLAYPDRLIPASLDVEGIAGLARRLQAGANVVTSLIPPAQGLSGVAQSELDIEEGRRTAAEVRQVLQLCGLQSATRAEYERWLALRKGANACGRFGAAGAA